jgi:hypothetical protein
MDYNEHILDILQSLPPQDHLVINYELLQKKDRDVYNFLTDGWGFRLNYFPFDKVYKQDHISQLKDIDSLISDTSLIDKAKEIETRFKRYMRVA